MEAVAAFGLAGTILQFIDSGAKFISLANRLHYAASEDGTSNSDIRKVTTAFKNLLPQLETDAGADDDEQDMQELAKTCGKTAKHLLERLEKLRLPENPRKRDVFKAAFQQTYRKDEILSLNDRLYDFRSQLNLHLVYSIRKHAAKSDAQRSEDLKRLRAIHEGVDKIDGARAEIKKIGGLAENILQYLIERELGPGDHNEEARQLQQELAQTLVRECANSSDGHRPAESVDLSSEQRQSAESLFLASLQYSEMVDRESRISYAHESTFQWVLEDRNMEASSRNSNYTNVKSWLGATDQLYWITGKAGSGKSTLVKYLCSPPYKDKDTGDGSSMIKESRCLPLLRTWASPFSPLIASFYFWNSGAQIQMNQEGLLRALLHQLLTQRPDIIPHLAPLDWETIYLFNREPQERTADNLEALLLRAIEMLLKDTKICFFIDGLDEFDGSQELLINTVRKLITCGDNVKVLTASRPWTIFQNAFGQAANLRLEDLTYDDITKFVHDRFNADHEFENLRGRKPEFANQLMENIVVKASGVFLWVDLVVSSLLAGMRLGDRIEDFQRRLDELPPDLERLYEKILQSLDEFYLDHAAQYFSLIEAAKTPLTTVQFSFADEESPESALSMEIRALSRDDISQRIEGVSKRLNSRCKGLLEVERGLRSIERDDWQQAAHLNVQYLHRTVRDFIKSPKSQAYLKSKRDRQFDPNLQLCIAYLMGLKSWSSGKELNRLWDKDELLLPVFTVIDCLQSASDVLKSNAGAVVRLLDDLDRVTSIPGYRKLLGFAQANLDGLPESGRKPLYIPGGHLPFTIRWPRQELASETQSALVYKDLEGSGPYFQPTRVTISAQSNWTIEHITTPSVDGSLLSLACVHGVDVYVKARAQWGGFIIRDSKEGSSYRWPLMLDTLSNDIVEPKMVQCLLDLGTDPNFRVGELESQSLWMIALNKASLFSMHSALIPLEMSSQAGEKWKEAVRLFFNHGATITEYQDMLLTPPARLILKEIRTNEGKSPLEKGKAASGVISRTAHAWRLFAK